MSCPTASSGCSWLVAGKLLGRATFAYLPDNILYRLYSGLWRRTCWIKSQEKVHGNFNQTETQAAGEHRLQGGCRLDTGFPEALALLRQVGIKETEGKVRLCTQRGSQPSSSTSSLSLRPHSSATISTPGEAHPGDGHPLLYCTGATSLTFLKGCEGLSGCSSKPASSRSWFFTARHPSFQAAVSLSTGCAPGLLSLLLPVGFNCIKKQVFEGYCFFFFYSHFPCFVKFFVLEKSLNFTGKLDLVMSGLASAALPKQTSHRERGGSSPMEPSSPETLSGSASHTLPCTVPAGIETATGKPLKTISAIRPWVCSCSDQIRENTRKKNPGNMGRRLWRRLVLPLLPNLPQGACPETVKKGWRERS